MEIRDYLQIFRKRWILIVIAIVVGTAAALGITLLTRPEYTARTQLVVSAIQRSGDVSSDELVQGNSYSRAQVQTYVQLVTQPIILQPAIEKIGLDATVDQLAEHVSADSPVSTTIIDIDVTWFDPRTAADIANAIDESMSQVIQEMETPTGSTTPRVKITTSSAATPPEAPSSPKVPLNIALGFGAGLVLGCLFAVMRELLDTRVKDPRDLAKITPSSVLALVPLASGSDPDALVINSNPAGLRAEAFRKLRTNLRFVDFEKQPKSIVVTSSIPGEAKTTTAINLATTVAAAGMRVCLVEGDLRRPRLAEYLGIEGAVGLTSVLIGQVNLAGALQPLASLPSLHVLTAGQIPPNPAEWLGSATMNRLLKSLESQYDMVVIDAPPLLPVTDAAVLAAEAGGALLVVASGKVNQDEVQHSLATLKSVDARLLGIVMTFVHLRKVDAYAATYEPLEV